VALPVPVGAALRFLVDRGGPWRPLHHCTLVTVYGSTGHALTKVDKEGREGLTKWFYSVTFEGMKRSRIPEPQGPPEQAFPAAAGILIFWAKVSGTS